MDDLELHAHLIGRPGSRAELNTPVLVVDLDALDRNIAAMQALADARGVALRPHAKTHKSVDIARRQVAAGAVGQCCAKIGEAEVLADSGITGILITSPVAASPAIERLAVLAGRSAGLTAVVDDPTVVGRLQTALAAADTRLDVVIDIDPGIHRTGVASAAAAVELARTIADAANLRLHGVQFYCGSHQHIADFVERRAAIVERTDYLREVIAALTTAGFPPALVTGSGTGTHRIDLELGVFTELQAGSYIFMDRQYLDCDLSGDGSLPFSPSLAVDTRVVSANHADLVTIDAGFKALSTDGGKPLPYGDGVPVGSGFAFMGDEHGKLVAPGIAAVLRPGDVVSLTVPHCDPTVNLFDHYHLVRNGSLVAIWPVSARGHAR